MSDPKQVVVPDNGAATALLNLGSALRAHGIVEQNVTTDTMRSPRSQDNEIGPIRSGNVLISPTRAGLEAGNLYVAIDTNGNGDFGDKEDIRLQIVGNGPSTLVANGNTVVSNLDAGIRDQILAAARGVAAGEAVATNMESLGKMVNTVAQAQSPSANDGKGARGQ